MLGLFFSIRTMKAIKNCLMKKNTCVMALAMINKNNGKIPKNMYRVFSCVVYTIIDNYVCIDYLSCQSKPLAKFNAIHHLNIQVSIYYSVLAFQNCY